MTCQTWNGPGRYELLDGRFCWVDRYSEGEASYGGHWLGAWFGARALGRPDMAARAEAIDAILTPRAVPVQIAA